ncbi:hypothetical protein J1614_008429 [Plenodomus biglobosus]|nr:hypothetical protein J1614_008429 [Plenodomus biglobosus]
MSFQSSRSRQGAAAQEARDQASQPMLSFTSEHMIECGLLAMQNNYPHVLYDHLLKLLEETRVKGVRIDSLVWYWDQQPNFEGGSVLLENIAWALVDENGIFNESENSFVDMVEFTHNKKHDYRALELYGQADFGTFWNRQMGYAARTPGAKARSRAYARKIFNAYRGKPEDYDSDADDMDDEPVSVEDQVADAMDTDMATDSEDEADSISDHDSDLDTDIDDFDSDIDSEYESDFEDVGFVHQPSHIVDEAVALRFVGALPRVDITTFSQEDRQCAVCFDGFEVHDDVRPDEIVPVRLPCAGRHVFCQACMVRTLTETGPQCPFDREDVVAIARREGWL